MRYFIALCLCFPLVLQAGSHTTKQMAETFFTTMQKGEINQAYTQLLAGSVILRDQPQALSILANQTQSEFNLNGKMLGYELIDDDDYGQSLVRLLYLVKQENIPSIWELHFYKPKDTWFLTGITFSQNLEKLR